MIGWYYLHTNGDLIYKRELGGTAADIRESPFAIMLWPVIPHEREGAWTILVEALALGARPERIKELAEQWKCDDDDAQTYAERIRAKLFKDGDQWCVARADFINLQESPAGFGSTCLEALADLCKVLGYKPGKTWGTPFKDLLEG